MNRVGALASIGALIAGAVSCTRGDAPSDEGFVDLQSGAVYPSVNYLSGPGTMPPTYG